MLFNNVLVTLTDLLYPLLCPLQSFDQSSRFTVPFGHSLPQLFDLTLLLNEQSLIKSQLLFIQKDVVLQLQSCIDEWLQLILG